MAESEISVPARSPIVKEQGWGWLISRCIQNQLPYKKYPVDCGLGLNPVKISGVVYLSINIIKLSVQPSHAPV